MTDVVNDPRPAEKPKKRPRRWLRRIVMFVLIVFVLLVIARVVAQAMLPDILGDLLREHGIECEYERLDVSLTTLDVELWNLVARDVSTGDELLDVEYVRADVSVWDLVHGLVVVQRVEIDGAIGHVHRFDDGRWSLTSAPPESSAPDPTDANEAPADDADGTPPGAADERAPISLDPPIGVRAVRVQNLELHVHDHTTSPVSTLVINGDVRVSHVGMPERDTKISVAITSTPHVGIIRVAGSARSEARVLSARLGLDVIDLRPRTLHAELTALGLEPLADSLTLSAALEVDLALDENDVVSGDVNLRDLAFTADGDVALGIEALEVPCVALTTEQLTLGDVRLRGVTGHTYSDADGAFVAGGIRFVPTASTPEEPDEPESGGAFAFALEHLDVDDVDLVHELATTEPLTTIALEARTIDLRSLAFPLDDTRPPPSLDIDASLPGIVSNLTLAAQSSLQPEQGSATLTLSGNGVALDALEPLLYDAGLASSLTSATLGLSAAVAWERRADESVALQLALEDLALVNGDDTLLAGLAGAHVHDLVLPADDGGIDVREVSVQGIAASAWRSVDDIWSAFGITPLGPDAPAPTVSAAPRYVPLFAQRMLEDAAPEPGAVAAAPSQPDIPDQPVEPDESRPLHVGRVVVEGPQLTVVDSVRGRTVSVDQLRAEITEIVIGDGPPRVDRVSLSLGANHFVRTLELDLAVTDSGPTFAMQGSLTADGLSLNDMAEDLGLETWMGDGHLAATVSTSWSSDDDGFHVGGRVDDFVLADASRELFAFEDLVLEQATFGDTTHIPSLTWTRPRVAITKRDDGRFDLLGITLGGDTADASSAAPTPDAGAASGAPAAPSESGGLLDVLAITGAGLDWTDPSGSSRVDLDVSGSRLGWGALGRKGTIDLTVAIPAALDEFKIDGDLDTSPGALAAQLTLLGRGLRAGPLARYLPEGVAVTWDDASLDGVIDVAWAANEKGGHTARLGITNLLLTDATREYLSIPRFLLDAKRLDVDKRRYNISELRLNGLRTAAARDADGNVDILGVVLANTPEVPTDDAPTAISAAEIDPDADAASARERVRSALSQRLAERAMLKQDMQIDISVFDVTIEHVEFADALAPEPIVIRDVHLRSREAIALPAQPVELTLDASVSPFVEQISLVARLEAEDTPAHLEMRIDAAGLSTPGSDISRALRASLEVDWTSARGAPLQYDPQRGVSLNARISDVAVSETPESEALFGFEDLIVDSLRFQPARNSLTVSSILLQGPRADILRDAEGFTVAGLFIPSPKDVPAKDAASAANVEQEAQPETAIVDGEPLEIRVGSAILTGVDCVYNDVTTTPPTLFPIEELDLEVRSIDVGRLPFGHVVPFTLFVRGGLVPPGTVGKSGTKPVRVLGGLDVAGHLGIQPTLDGIVDVDIYQLELAALAGLANEYGVSLEDGTFDLDARYTFRGDGALDARNKLHFTDLDLSEPPGGILSSALFLAAPIQAIVAILRDEVGVIELSVDFKTGTEGFSFIDITRLAATTLSKQVARAITNSPFRVLNFGAGVAGQVGDLTGVTGLLNSTTKLMGVGDIESDVPLVLDLSFSPGVVAPAGRFADAIAVWSKLMEEDESLLITLTHEIGTEDVDRMTTRLDPSDDVVRASVDELRGRRTALIAKRTDVLGRARAAQAVSPTPNSDPTVVRLARVNEELGLVERALDATLELMGPAAKRRAELRVSKGCVELATARLEALRRLILANERDDMFLTSMIKRRSTRDWSSRIRIQRPRFEPSEDRQLSRVVVALERLR